MTLKILTVVGARPQFIKSSAISREIAKRDSLTEYVIHTGQHYDELMSDIFFQDLGFELNITNLDINNVSETLFVATAMAKIESEIIKFKPDVILLYGDTNSTLAGALVGNKCGVDILHVEGGVRNLDRSIPEETNRIITDNLSKVIFYSTDDALLHLKNEGLNQAGIDLVKTDDLMSDGLKLVLEGLCSKKRFTGDYALVTLHRGFNLEPHCLSEIVHFLNTLAEEIELVFPIHPNTRNMIKKYGLHLSANIQLLEPLSHSELIEALNDALYVITDSGGLQREAYMLKKKSLIILDRTPWVELLEAKCVQLSKPVSKDLTKALETLLEKPANFSTPFYGNGNASTQICDYLEKLYECK